MFLQGDLGLWYKRWTVPSTVILVQASSQDKQILRTIHLIINGTWNTTVLDLIVVTNQVYTYVFRALLIK